MTAHHMGRFDRLRVSPPPEQPDYSGADLERDMDDLLHGIEAVGLFDGDGELYGLRIGKLTLTEAQVRMMLDPAHFDRIRYLDDVTLRRLREDWEQGQAEMQWEDRGC